MPLLVLKVAKKGRSMEDELKEACQDYLDKQITTDTFKSLLGALLLRAKAADLKEFAEYTLIALQDERGH